MLDSETKRRIDTARDILVGKVPDPKSQVEQITIALIYKFMDDMDAQAEELGGKRKFFAGAFTQYGWAKLMSPSVSGEERIALYSEGIVKMPQNPGIPRLFRDIFKNAFLPYRDSETLKAFLKTINEFEYDHSERLGDAFEYLLSALGSQGQAGQFRTPRHIIDFIVAIVDPQKTETVLDPACGTAGFLISAYKHILRANSTPASIEQATSIGEAEATLHTSKIPFAKGDKLTPDERKKLADNFRGYDISPDMVRLSLVNMYLHGFTDPHVYEYDTLTSQDRWNEMADVILANPPFMSPKGGIKPHNRFSVQSKRSEVLFVDYMAEHLTPGGRAGVIVPEGIIFQSQTAYKALRMMLVEQYLIAVVSLPAGVFNPYSGVKTSILILDKSLAKQSDTVGFFKVEDDGFNLGAQRRPIDKNDLPQVLADANEYLRRLRAKESVAPEDFKPTCGLIVAKEKIAANGDYNLSGERYRESDGRAKKFPIVPLRSICSLEYGFTASASDSGDARFIRITDIDEAGRLRPNDAKYITLSDESREFLLKPGDLLVARTGATFGKTMRFAESYPAVFASYLIRLRFENVLLPEFYWAFAQTEKYWEQARSLVSGGGQPQFNGNAIKEIEIPLPPLEVQKEIVAEIEAYQRVIDGARAVLDHYRPHIPIQSDWPMVELGEIAENLDSKRVPITESDRKPGPYPYYGASGVVDHVADFIFNEDLLLVSEDGANLLARSTPIAFSVSGKIWVNNHAHVLRFPEEATRRFVEIYLNSIPIDGYVTGSAQPKLNQKALAAIEIPLPPLEAQRAIVSEIEAERRLVEANRELIARMETKTAATLARIWGEEAAELALLTPSKQESRAVIRAYSPRERTAALDTNQVEPSDRK
jgi:type I restriction enzyme M protein